MKKQFIKTSIIAATLLVSSIKAQVPTHIFANSAGSNNFNEETSTAVKVLSTGYILTTGYFCNSITLGSTVLTSAGSTDAYVAAISPTGTYAWAFKLGGTGTEQALTITSDNSAVYVGGFFWNTVDFNPSVSGTYNLSAGASGSSGFIAKYDLNGNFIWAHKSGACVNSLYVDALTSGIFLSDKIIAGGYFQNTTDFTEGITIEPGYADFPHILTSSGSKDAFFATYNRFNQNFFGVAAISGVGDDEVKSLSTEYALVPGFPSTNISQLHIVGTFKGTNVDFNPGSATANLTSSGTSAFYATYNFIASEYFYPPYTYVNAFILGSGGTVKPKSIVTGDNAVTYVVGNFIGTADFDPSAGVANLTAPYQSGFIVSYYRPGVYGRSFSLGSSTGPTSINGIAEIISNNPGQPKDIYLTGHFTGSVDFDPNAGVALLGSNKVVNTNIFVARYDSGFVYNRAVEIGGTLFEEGTDIDAYGLDNCTPAFVGNFNSSNVDFDLSFFSSNILSANANTKDIFHAKYDFCNLTFRTAAPNTLSEIDNTQLQLSVFPNPNTGIFTINSDQALSISVYNILGEKVLTANLREGKNELTIQHQPAGVYFIRSANLSKDVKIIKTN